MEPGVYAAMAAVEDRHWWFRARRAIAAHILRRLDLPPSTAILDVGSGTGGNLAMLARFGRVHPMELNAEARAISDKRNLAKAAEGMLPEQIPFGAQKFDLITMFDVLEHIERDLDTLTALRARLSDNGYLLITVPAFPSLWSSHDAIHHHKRRYRLPQLVQLAERAGYAVRLVTYSNFWLFPMVSAARFLERLRGERHQAGPLLAIPRAPLNRLLEVVFASERHLIGVLRAPFGVSIVLLAGHGGARAD